MVAVAVAVYVVLREVVAIERPPAPDPAPSVPASAPAPVPERPPRTSPVADPESMLATLALATESDERSVVRRMAALFVLLTITLVTAALVGAGIYRAVAGLD